jgi:NADH dehydrogenase
MHRAVQREFKQLPKELCKVILVDVVDRVLPTMAPELSSAAGCYLEKAGVKLKLGAKVEDISPGRVSLRSLAGLEVLEAATICWTAGVRASKLGKLLADRTGCPVDRGGRLLVEPDFSVPGHPEIRAVGDTCAYTHTADGKPLPGMAGPAVQMGGWVAQDILSQLKGQASEPFRWVDLGSMAVIGPWYAVADLRGWHVTGLMGWVLWALAHLAFIPDTENRIALFSKWMWQIATRQRTALLITGRPDQHIGVDVGLFRAQLEEREPAEDEQPAAA